MSDLRVAWIIVVAVVAGVSLLVYGITILFDRRRTAALAQVAQQMGFSYQHDGTPFPGAPPAVHLLNVGRERKFLHVLLGWTAGMDASVFDYKYVTGHGRSQRTHRVTVAAYRLPHSFANFHLSNANWKDTVSGWFGGQNVKFDDAPEFSKRYRLQGRDEPSIRAGFRPAVLKYFESLPKNPWTFESSEGWVLVYKSGSRVSGSSMQDFIRETSNLAAGFKQVAGLT